MTDPLQIIVDNRVRFGVSDLPEEVKGALVDAFEHRNPEFFKRQSIGVSTWKTPRTISTWRSELHGGQEVMSFPRGGLTRIRDILDEYGIDRHIEDRRADGELPFGEMQIPDHRVELWEHQTKCVEAALENQNCILKAPTGSGKTTFGFAIAAKVKVQTLVIVPNTTLFKQWIKRAQNELGLKKKDIGQIRGKTRIIKPLTIAMQKTLAVQGVDEELARYFGMVICDEVQLFAAATFQAAVDPFAAKYRIGISADHRRKDKKEFLIYDLFGGVACEISRRELIEKGIIVDTTVRVIPTSFTAPWYKAPERKKDTGFDDYDPNRKAPFVPPEPPPEEETSLDWDRLLGEMTADDDRNTLALWCVKDGLRIDKQVITMTHRREHCRAFDMTLVQHGITTGFLIGGQDYAREFDDARDRFEQGKIQVGVGTFQAIGYGIDLPKASVVVCLTPIAANRQFFGQVRGRVCRGNVRGKTESWMYYLWDEKVFGIEHLKNLIRWNDSRVVVWQSGKWIDAKQFLRERRAKAA